MRGSQGPGREGKSVHAFTLFRVLLLFVSGSVDGHLLMWFGGSIHSLTHL